MSNLIPLEEAARMLGVSVDKLNEMRSNNDIFGYKDGASWKFKMQEIERVADELNLSIKSGDSLVEEDLEIAIDHEDEISFDIDDSTDLVDIGDIDDDDEIQLLDDEPEVIKEEQGILELEVDDEDVVDLEADGEGEQVIEFLEDDDEVVSLDDDDSMEISLADDDDDLSLVDDDAVQTLEPSAVEGSDFELADDELAIASESDDFQLHEDKLDIAEDDTEDGVSLGSSDINLAGGDDPTTSPENTGDLLGSRIEDDFALADAGPATGDLLAEDSGEDSGLLLAEDDLFEDDLKIQESHEDDIDLSSDFESSDLIMEDSDSSEGSAVIGDDDSGFMLDDDSVEMGSSLMDLAGADDEEMIVLDEPAAAADSDSADDDFNLTPLEEVVDEESSGSQIIALEDSEMFSDESAATLLSPSDEMEAAPMLTEDAMDSDFGGFDTGVPGMASGVAINPNAVGALPEQPYTLWQVVSLGLVLFLMLVGGMVGYDLARNLWLPEDQIISGGVLPMILNLVGG